MTLKPCTDPDIRFSYFGTGMVTHKIAVEKAGDDRYFLIRIKHGVPPEFNHTGQIIAYFLCIHKLSCINRSSSEDKRQMNTQKWQIEHDPCRCGLDMLYFNLYICPHEVGLNDLINALTQL